VYYGIDTSAFAPPQARERLAARASFGIAADRPVAIFIGALGDRRKGFDLLFDAWQSLTRDGGWDADLIVVGAGAEQEAWASRVRAAGLTSVHILGFRTDVASLLAAADVVVHPARYEAYGLGVHEAICRGVPAIVSATAGVAERFPADVGPLLLPAGAGALDVAAALVTWQRDPALWRARAADLSVSFRARTWDDMAADVAAAVEAA
jgi:glycosyltransferase involved in cell wall biosynthesis